MDLCTLALSYSTLYFGFFYFYLYCLDCCCCCGSVPSLLNALIVSHVVALPLALGVNTVLQITLAGMEIHNLQSNLQTFA